MEVEGKDKDDCLKEEGLERSLKNEDWGSCDSEEVSVGLQVEVDRIGIASIEKDEWLEIETGCSKEQLDDLAKGTGWKVNSLVRDLDCC